MNKELKTLISVLKDKKFWTVQISILLIGLIILPSMVSSFYPIDGHYNLFSGRYIPSQDKIIINNNSTITLRHELIHREQEERGYPTNIFLKEVEAYIKMYFIWNKVNLTTLDYQI